MSGTFDPSADGVDSDGDGSCDGGDVCVGDDSSGDLDEDGVCDDVDTDDDGDGVEDDVDLDDRDRFRCVDTDEDGCDDCVSGTFDPSADGVDSDGDGSCDSGDVCVGDDSSGDLDEDGVCDDVDTDVDGDGVEDDVDSDDRDRFRCVDTDEDGCDDCVSGTFDPSADGVDSDGDGVCDTGDVCPGEDDAVDLNEDGVPDGCDGVCDLDEVADCDGTCDPGDAIDSVDCDGVCDVTDGPMSVDCDGICDEADAPEGPDCATYCEGFGSYVSEKVDLTDYDTSATWSRLVLGDDEVSEPVDIGFEFSYFGQRVEQVRVAANGFVYIGSETDSTGGCCSGGTVPSERTPNNAIAVYWHDMFPTGGGEIKTATLGEAPYRQFVVWYDDVHACCSSVSTSRNTTNAQLVLFEEDQHFEIRVLQGGSNGVTATVGYENADGTVGEELYRSTFNLDGATYIVVPEFGTCDGVCGIDESAASDDCDGVCDVYDDIDGADCDGVCEPRDASDGVDCDERCDEGEDGSTDCDGVCGVFDASGGPDCDGVCDELDVLGSPDCLGTCLGVYEVESTPLTDYDEGGKWTTVTLTDDQVSAPIDIGFDFPYYDDTISQVRVVSNGFVYLGTEEGAPLT